MTHSMIVAILVFKMAWVWLPITLGLIGLSHIEGMASRKVNHPHK